ncbi:MAG: hypothetical protein AMJ84_01660 [Acidithiobacillales bacterium SM23_46]|jgi:intracellular sulfur oxidation DsrE/DsrF family protein|nr:MAG: hypothetical protein AMJ84_01660 [Acidithiobacillales bacterium SM23_46]KPL27709.1 MAG: hypothetical protein AMJ72_07340 [Acidithiobacillales bacterium SM1_46]
MGKFVASMMAAAFALGLAANAQAAGYDKQKVVYHINSADTKTQKGALRNIQNHINAVGKDNLDLRVVMHGGGVAMLQTAQKDEDMKGSIEKLKLQGIHFNVCANTLKGKKLNYKTDLYDVSEKDIVPSGVAEIAALQQKGYVYVKP